jgi:ATP-dependent helicase/nuclease subunit B
VRARDGHPGEQSPSGFGNWFTYAAQEKEATRGYDQPDIVQLRDALIDNILLDMARIAQGAILPALGEGKACDYCAARGLCRKDFWT